MHDYQKSKSKERAPAVQQPNKLSASSRIIYLVSPIWPTKYKRSLGAFVKVISESLESNGWTVSKAAVGKSGASGPSERVFRYLRMILGILLIPSKRGGIVYSHLPTWFSIFLIMAHWIKPQPYIVNLHGSDIHAQKKLAKLFWPITKRYISNADLVVVPSQTFANAVSAKLDARRIFVSPSGGVITERFNPCDTNSARQSVGLPQDKVIFGFVSRIVEGKGWRVFVEVIGKLREAGCDAYGVILGEGPDEKNLSNEIRIQHLEHFIQFRGAVFQTDLPNYYNSFDVFLFPSKISSVDSLGLVALEAMSCGTPVVALDTTLTREYLQPGINGELAISHDGAGFANAAKRVLDRHDPTLSSKHRIADSVKQYANVHVGKELSNQFLQVGAKGRKRRASR